MIITCPQCSTKFDLDEEHIPQGRAKARCSRCHHTFEVQKSSPFGLTPDEIPHVIFKEKTRSAKGPGPRKALWAIGIVVLLSAGIGYGAWAVWHKSIDLKKTEVFFSTCKRYIGLVSQREGSLTLEKVQGYYWENIHLKKIFIIEGWVVNRWDEPRSFVRVRGTLLNSKGETVEEKIAYCGNILSEKDLREMDREAIEKSLSSQFGESLSNLNIDPNRSIPFMIVFTDLASSTSPGRPAGESSGKPGEGSREPSDFTIEVVGSQKGSK